MSDYAPAIRPLNVRKGSAHPWIVESETNIPEVKVEIARFAYRPHAALFAAAPDLLAVCKAIKESGALARVPGCDCSVCGMVDALHAAIAKAEGRQP